MAKPCEPVTAAEIITKLRLVYDEALATGQFSAAARAAELLGKHINLFGATLPTSNPLNPENINDPRLEKLAKMADALTKSIQ